MSFVTTLNTHSCCFHTGASGNSRLWSDSFWVLLEESGFLEPPKLCSSLEISTTSSFLNHPCIHDFTPSNGTLSSHIVFLTAFPSGQNKCKSTWKITEAETLLWGPVICVSTSSPGASEASSSFRTTALPS